MHIVVNKELASLKGVLIASTSILPSAADACPAEWASTARCISQASMRGKDA